MGQGCSQPGGAKGRQLPAARGGVRPELTAGGHQGLWLPKGRDRGLGVTARPQDSHPVPCHLSQASRATGGGSQGQLSPSHQTHIWGEKSRGRARRVGQQQARSGSGPVTATRVSHSPVMARNVHSDEEGPRSSREVSLEEPIALHYHVGQALRRCQVLAQLPLVRLPQAALPLAQSSGGGGAIPSQGVEVKQRWCETDSDVGWGHLIFFNKSNHIS